MTTIIEIIFYAALFLVLNSFIIYPVVVFLMSRRYRGRITIHGFEPTVSILIAAYNEEKVIALRIKNIAALEYDFNKIEVLIESDQSTDRTDEILLEHQALYPWLKVFVAEKRKGKAGILNELITKAKHEIIVFTDANTEFAPDTLKNLVEDFADKKIGGVCGRLILIEDEKSKSEGVEEGNYWKYETIIKSAEGKCGILFSANGGIFAIRKELYRDIPTTNAVTDDLFLSLSVVDQNFKFTYNKNAIAFESTGKDLQAEYKRKVRFGATNFQTLIFFKHLLNLARGFLAYAFFSHKVSRWFLPGLLIILFFSSYFLVDTNWFAAKVYYAQFIIYLLAFCGYLLSLIKVRIALFSLPYFFVLSNVAIAEGFVKFLRNEHSVIWKSTER